MSKELQYNRCYNATIKYSGVYKECLSGKSGRHVSYSVTKMCHKNHVTHFWDDGHLEMILDANVRNPILISLRSQCKEFGYYPKMYRGQEDFFFFWRIADKS